MSASSKYNIRVIGNEETGIAIHAKGKIRKSPAVTITIPSTAANNDGKRESSVHLKRACPRQRSSTSTITPRAAAATADAHSRD